MALPRTSGSSTASPEALGRTLSVWRRESSRSTSTDRLGRRARHGRGGVFDVHVDGELVFEKKMLGRYPQPDDVMPLLAAKLG